MLFIYDFNLILPSQDILMTELKIFNRGQVLKKLPTLNVEAFDDDDYLSLEAEDEYGDCIIRITGSAINPGVTNNGSFTVYRDIIDNTDDNVCIQFLAYLCQKYEGTFIALFTTVHGTDDEEEIHPLKIINGKRINCILMLKDV